MAKRVKMTSFKPEERNAKMQQERNAQIEDAKKRTAAANKRYEKAKKQ